MIQLKRKNSNWRYITSAFFEYPLALLICWLQFARHWYNHLPGIHIWHVVHALGKPAIVNSHWIWQAWNVCQKFYINSQDCKTDPTNATWGPSYLILMLKPSRSFHNAELRFLSSSVAVRVFVVMSTESERFFFHRILLATFLQNSKQILLHYTHNM